MSGYHNNSIFWVETEKISPNPFQPRREFEPKALEDLADSIRQYGVLQPLVVTRKEIILPDNNGMDVQYELIAGERRLRASKLAGLQQVPVIIRKETDNKVKLELAIIENLQREDLNPIDRARAFEQLHKEFGLTHVEIGKRMGKSRVYVSNTLRLLSLPEEIKQGLMQGRISEGHTRPLLMLIDRPQEQNTLFKEIMIKKLSVRDAERVARKIAQDKVRKKEFIIDPKIQEFEKKLSENLGTRVHIEPKENGGQIMIDYFTVKDLEGIISSIKKVDQKMNMMDSYLEEKGPSQQERLEQSTSLSFKESPQEEEMTIPEIITFDLDSSSSLDEDEDTVSLPQDDSSQFDDEKSSLQDFVDDEVAVIEESKPITNSAIEYEPSSDPYLEDISDELTKLPSVESMAEESTNVSKDNVNLQEDKSFIKNDLPLYPEPQAEVSTTVSNFQETISKDNNTFDKELDSTSALPSSKEDSPLIVSGFGESTQDPHTFDSQPADLYQQVQEIKDREVKAPALDAAYQSYQPTQQQEYSQASVPQQQTYNEPKDNAQPISDNNYQQHVPANPPLNVQNQAPQSGNTDAYYNPQYYNQSAQNTYEPKKKGFLGKLFG